jgi:hypothetical protein
LTREMRSRTRMEELASTTKTTANPVGLSRIFSLRSSAERGSGLCRRLKSGRRKADWTVAQKAIPESNRFSSGAVLTNRPLPAAAARRRRPGFAERIKASRGIRGVGQPGAAKTGGMTVGAGPKGYWSFFLGRRRSGPGRRLPLRRSMLPAIAPECGCPGSGSTGPGFSGDG